MEYVIAAIITVLVVGAVLVVTALLYSRNRRRTQFGPEYDHTLEELGDRKRTEQELEQRKRRVEDYGLRPLTAAERDEFTETWKRTESRFVDEPSQALNQADHLLLQVIKTRGYQLNGPGQIAADLSVRHPSTVGSYRFAHATVIANERGEVNTEELREAMMHFRRIFEDIIADEAGAAEPQQHEVSAG